MSRKYRFLKEHRLIVLSMSGPFTIDGVRRMATILTDDPEFVWNYDRLVFVKQDADFSDMSYELFRDSVDVLTEKFFPDQDPATMDLPAYRAAVVCGPTINEIVMRLFGAVWKSGDRQLVEVELFMQVSQALAWLGRDEIPVSEFQSEMIGV